MASDNDRRFPRICSLLDGFGEVMAGIEGITKILVRIARDCALIGLALGILTGTGTLHQAAEFFG